MGCSWRYFNLKLKSFPISRKIEYTPLNYSLLFKFEFVGKIDIAENWWLLRLWCLLILQNLTLTNHTKGRFILCRAILLWMSPVPKRIATFFRRLHSIPPRSFRTVDTSGLGKDGREKEMGLQSSERRQCRKRSRLSPACLLAISSFPRLPIQARERTSYWKRIWDPQTLSNVEHGDIEIFISISKCLYVSC